MDSLSIQGEPVHVPDALGQSEAFISFQEQISKVAPVERPVLILGERGTGKELAASRIHFLSRRWEKPFITLNCAALSPTLIESELFGYEKGAFTGAAARQIGRFEKASAGTLFLDEVGNIPMEVQAKILRVVEYGSFERVGSSAPVSVDVRIVAATNADLSGMARGGRFKQDLLDRLSFEVIHVPPLRFRKGDIELLANHFAARMAFELNQENMPSLGKNALSALESYPWPGNIRELKNVIERAVYKSSRDEIRQIDFNPFVNPYQGEEQSEDAQGAHDINSSPAGKGGRISPDPEGNALLKTLLASPLKKAVAALEAHLVLTALETAKYNQRKAAQSLGLTYDQFRGLFRKHRLS